MKDREMVLKLNSCPEGEIDEIIRAEPRQTLAVLGWLRRDRRELVINKIAVFIPTRGRFHRRSISHPGQRTKEDEGKAANR